MIEVKQIHTKREMKDFCNFPLTLYKDCPYYCPAFFDDEMSLIDDSKNVYLEFCDNAFFLAYKDGKVAGRISCIINHAHNNKTNTKKARFTRLEAIDDFEVFKALMDTAEQYALDKGMTAVEGPLGYTDLDREGLLVEGYDYVATYSSSYNYPYFAEYLEKLGYHKEFDWLERRLYMPKEVPAKIKKVAQIVKEKYGYRNLARECKTTSQFIDKYAESIFDMLDIGYANLPGTVPLTPKIRESTVEVFKNIVSVDFLSLLVDKDDNLVGLGIVIPDIVPALQKCKGKLLPIGIFRLLHALHHPKHAELMLTCVLPEYMPTGAMAVIVDDMLDNFIKLGIDYAETNLNYEENHNIMNIWQNFDNIQHKRKRCYIKNLVENKD